MDTWEEIHALQQRLRGLLDQDPRAALVDAQAIEAEGPYARELDILKAGVLIDAGAAVSDGGAVKSGVDILRSIVAHNASDAQAMYNLGNGLIALTDLDIDDFPSPAWYVRTHPMRHEARRLFWDTAQKTNRIELATQALTNLGNSLDKAYRWVEAYDMYQRALERDPTNGMAAGCAAETLVHRSKVGPGQPDLLLRVARHYRDRAYQHQDRVLQFGGQRAWETFQRLSALDGVRPWTPSDRPLGDYEAFVLRYRLPLTFTTEGLDLDLKRWDVVTVESITEPIDAPAEPPVVVAMFNEVKADFLVARQLLYESLNAGRAGETGFYPDTLDYALYGTDSAGIRLAQRAALDVLDRIAVLLNEYLATGVNPSDITFRTYWFERKTGTDQLALPPFVKDGPAPLLALAEMAADIRQGGFLHPIKAVRNTATHRFVVLHEPIIGPHRESRAVEHYGLDDFVDGALETMQLTRAAILYLAELIARKEHSQHGHNAVPLSLPPHHEIRGEP